MNHLLSRTDFPVSTEPPAARGTFLDQFIHSFETWGPLGWAMQGKGPGQERSRLCPPQHFGESMGLAPAGSPGPREPCGQSMQL